MSRSPLVPTDERLAAWGAPAGFRARLEQLLPATPEEAPGAWMRIVDELLEPAQDFALHEAVFAACYAGWHEAEHGPAPAWVPSDDERRRTNLATLGQGLDMEAVHRSTVEQASRFWTDMLEQLGIVVDSPPTAAIQTTVPAHEARWFPGMRLNIVESCLGGRDLSALALVAHAEDGAVTRWTLGDLRQRVVAVADMLRTLGVQPGDAVAIDMPMTAWSVPIYLGIVAVGAAVVSIADSFAPEQIRTRLEIGGARLIFTQDVIRRGGRRLPLYDRVVAADAPRAVVLGADGALSVALRDGDLSFAALLPDPLSPVDAPLRAAVADAEAVTNVLFSSGTTGQPKAIPWTHLTPIKAAGDGWAHHDIHPGDVVAWPTNLGWMMGPWLIYASLLNGAAIALYEGDPSSAGFCRFVQDAGVTMLGVVPSLVRAWRAKDATAGLDWSSIRCFSSTGEASRFDDMLWLMSRAGYRPVIEYCGGTEIGGGYITGSLLQPQAPACFSTPAVGAALLLIDDDGRFVDDVGEGEVALVPPQLGSSNRLLNRDHFEVYFAGMPESPDGRRLRRHGDRLARLPGGFYRAMGRMDDTMNLGGIKVSSAEIERACASAVELDACAAVAVPPPGGGPEQLVIFAVPAAGAPTDPATLAAAFQRSIRAGLNPLFKVAAVYVRSSLPRTASGKVMRRVLRQQLIDAQQTG